MSSPAETSQSPSPAPSHDDHFDPAEFWYLHKTKVIALAVLLVVGLVGYTAYTLNEQSARQAAENAYAGARTIEDFQRVITEHPGQIAAANAQLRLAALQRDAGKLDDANATLRSFIEKNPQHPLIGGAALSLAQNTEAAGKTDEALTAFQKISTTYPGSYAAPLALLGQARIQKAKGETDQARRIYEQIVAQFQNTPFQMEAMRALGELTKPGEAAPAADVAEDAITKALNAALLEKGISPSTPAPTNSATPAPAVTTPAPALTATPAPAASTPAPAATTPAPVATTPAPAAATPAPAAPATPAPAAPATPAPAAPATPAPAAQ